MADLLTAAPPALPEVSEERLRALQRDLDARVDGEVRFDAGSRSAYSTDASAFRQVPYGVVLPRTTDAAAEAVRVCHAHRVPVVSRGGGTSLAGQCTNTAVVIDFSKYCHRLISVDVEQRRCVVEPGIVLDDLNRRLSEHGLRFGPEPATHANCTLGGMIGNNSCGATAQRNGKVSDNIHALDVLLADGTRFHVGPTTEEEYHRIEAHGDRRAALYRSLRHLGAQHAEEIRRRFPDIPRRVSGYNLDALLPGGDLDLARFLVGSEGTLVTVLAAELDLVEVLPARTLVVIGYDDVASAADDVPRILPFEPIALEGFDDLLVHDEQLEHLNATGLGELPEGGGFLMAQFGAAEQDEADAQAHHLLDALEESPHARPRLVTDPHAQHLLWEVREAGLGASAHVPHHADAWPGWEDSAVSPDRLGDYLRDLQALFDRFGYATEVAPSLYGHFGQGCIHTRIPFDLTSAEGVATYRSFMEAAADLVTSYDGSLSGEHGDGQARAELLPRMFGDQLVRVMEQVKALFDPEDLLNPGKVVRPRPLDADLRLGADYAPRTPRELHFAYPRDEGSFARAANRCVGVGKCRQLTHDGPTVMCPSYQVTREEEDSTRGRARLLFEMLQGHDDSPLDDVWRSEEVRDALDLCLSCKGCRSDCPVGVDMATYKAEFLSHHYAGRLRPRADYATGWLPLAVQLLSRLHLAPLANAASHAPGLRRLGLAAAGLDTAREVPLLAPETLQQWFARTHRNPAEGRLGTVLVWPDTFTNHFHPEVGVAAVRVLERAGWAVTMPTEPLCCGLTWISTGQLATAERVLRRTVAALAPHVRAGGKVIGLEPSCTAVFRSDAAELLPDDPDAARLREATCTFAELLVDHTPDWEPPQLGTARVHAVAQVHCHQHAVLGWDADARLLAAMGVDAERLASGCCGLAGNFGFTAGHREVSTACAEQVLLPRLRSEPEPTVVLADGFSCRTQIHDLHSGPHEGRHLAELVDAAQGDGYVDGRSPLGRTHAPGPVARGTALAGAVAPLATAAALLRRRARRTHR